MASTTPPTAEIWFLTGSQGLYGPETLDQVAEQFRVIADRLSAQLPVRVVWKPVLLDRCRSTGRCWTPTAPSTASA